VPKTNAPSAGALPAEEKRNIANRRAAELKTSISDYLEAAQKIPTGFKLVEQYEAQKAKILQLKNATQENWDDWRWQMRNRFAKVEDLSQILNLTSREIAEITTVGERFRWAVSPYYLALMDPENENDPVRKQGIPSILEVQDTLGEDDPMGEEFTSPAPGVTRRYPDRLIIKVTNQCAMYCRHCQRRRNIGEVDRMTSAADLEAALAYVKEHEEIRDVLITGGDALMLNNDRLDWLLGELDQIEHVEIKRLGTRVNVTMPQRITPELVAVLEKHHPLYVNTQFNHPREVTPQAAAACDRLLRAGIPLGNQAVLLNGINNDPHVMKKLNHELLKIRVRPYYIFHAKAVTGTTHFNTKIEDGIAIMEKLRGYTSGLAIPTYIINAPGGYGKTPIQPNYLVSMGPDEITLRTWEGRVINYPNQGPEDPGDPM